MPYENVSEYEFIWTSSDQNIVKIDNKGRIIAVAEGTAKLKLRVRNKETDDIYVTVKNNNSIDTKIKKFTSTNDIVTLTVSGTEYTSETKIDLDRFNNMRTIKDLATDKHLIQIARQRAAELAVLFSDKRPNGETTVKEYLPSNQQNAIYREYYFKNAYQISGSFCNDAKNSSTKSFGSTHVKIGNDVYHVFIFSNEVFNSSMTFNNIATRDVNVLTKYLDEISIDKNSFTINKGEEFNNFSFKCNGYYVNKKSFQWSSSNKSVATVDSNGKITAIDSGNAVITASIGNVTFRINVSVVIPQSIKLNTFDYTMKTGDKHKIRAMLAIQEDITWLSSNENVAIVDKEGNVTAKAVGKTTITAKLKTCSATCKISVTQKDIQSLTINDIEDQVYTAQEIKPSIIVTIGDITLVEGKDYTINYKNNVNIGVATISITGKGNYTGSTTKTFNIIQKHVSQLDIEILEGPFTYNGKAQTPHVLVKDGNNILWEKWEYDLLYDDNINAGTTKVTITANGRGIYTGSITKTFNILPKNISEISKQIYTENKTYNGKEQKISSINLKYGSYYLYEDKDYTVNYKDNINVGTVTATIAGKGNYTGTISDIHFNILPKNISNINADVDTSPKIYNGKEQKTSIKLKDDNVTLKEGIHYTVSYKDNINVGKAIVTITGKGNYAGAITRTFKIEEVKEQDINTNIPTKPEQKPSEPTIKPTETKPSVTTPNKNNTTPNNNISKPTITVTTKNFPFKDVVKKDWYYNAVSYCYSNNIISGTSATTFSPDVQLTRGMLVTILYRMEKQPDISGTPKFKDVKNNKQYYFTAVKWASDKNIVSGYKNGNFGPNDPITREDLAVILCKYAKYKGKNTSQTNNLSAFSDKNKVSSYALPQMKWAVGAGVISGNSNGTLNPKGQSSRAEAAAMIEKYCKKIGR